MLLGGDIHLKKQIVAAFLYIYAVFALIVSGAIIKSDIVMYYLYTYSESYGFSALCMIFLVFTAGAATIFAFLYKGKERHIGDYIVVSIIYLAINICVSLRLILPLIKVLTV